MLLHRALGRDLHKLVIAVVDNRRPMLLVLLNHNRPATIMSFLA